MYDTGQSNSYSNRPIIMNEREELFADIVNYLVVVIRCQVLHPLGGSQRGIIDVRQHVSLIGVRPRQRLSRQRRTDKLVNVLRVLANIAHEIFVANCQNAARVLTLELLAK